MNKKFPLVSTDIKNKLYTENPKSISDIDDTSKVRIPVLTKPLSDYSFKDLENITLKDIIDTCGETNNSNFINVYASIPILFGGESYELDFYENVVLCLHDFPGRTHIMKISEDKIETDFAFLNDYNLHKFDTQEKANEYNSLELWETKDDSIMWINTEPVFVDGGSTPFPLYDIPIYQNTCEEFTATDPVNSIQLQFINSFFYNYDGYHTISQNAYRKDVYYNGIEGNYAEYKSTLKMTITLNGNSSIQFYYQKYNSTYPYEVYFCSNHTEFYTNSYTFTNPSSAPATFIFILKFHQIGNNCLMCDIDYSYTGGVS